MLKIKSLLFCVVLCALLTNSLSYGIEDPEDETPNDVSENDDDDDEYYDDEYEYDYEDKKRARRNDIQPKPNRQGAGHSRHTKHTEPKPVVQVQKRTVNYKAKKRQVHY